MASDWTSTIFVFKDGDGQDCVSTTLPLPPGSVIEASKLRVFRASGPYQPLSFNTGHTQVGDAVTWMADLTAKGFVFEPATAK